MQEEKYLILNNAHQYYTILRCTRRTLDDYIHYGKARVLKADGSLDLLLLSEWLTNRRVCHRVQMSQEKNPILRYMLQKEIKKMNQSAVKQGLYLSDKERDSLLDGIEAGNFDLCWNTLGMARMERYKQMMYGTPAVSSNSYEK
jgi:hypothetical protein